MNDYIDFNLRCFYMRLFVTESAYIKKDIERSLMDPNREIIEYLIRLYLVHDESIRSHLKDNIVKQIKSIPRIKNKFPTAKQIYKWTYYKKQDLITDRNWMAISVKNIEEIYNIKVTTPIDKICNDLDHICYEYYTWLANELSSFGFIIKGEACDKLDIIISSNQTG